jgi:hypothetical protein
MPRVPRPKQILIGALNIASDPHPKGIYERLLLAATNREIEIWGSDYAKITAPEAQRTNPDILQGRILVWTRVDRRGSWIDKDNNQEATPEKKAEINIPDPLEPNFRTFYYAFIISKHRLVYEMRNAEGQNFGTRKAEKFFRELLSRQILGADFPEVSVTPIPEDDAVKKILEIPNLKRLEITLTKPNPDDLEEETVRLLEELENQGAKQQKLTLIKAPGVPSLTPNENTKTLALVASENGYVKGKGVDAEGNPVDESTKEHPKSIPVDLRPDQSALYVFIRSVSRFL